MHKTESTKACEHPPASSEVYTIRSESVTDRLECFGNSPPPFYIITSILEFSEVIRSRHYSCITVISWNQLELRTP